MKKMKKYLTLTALIFALDGVLAQGPPPPPGLPVDDYIPALVGVAVLVMVGGYFWRVRKQKRVYQK